jgi:malonate-semialdehyde dehydrogenase (acetylating)/methylmalonate-semialdehyde dehydrogenase
MIFFFTEPFSFGGLYGTDSKFGDFDITGDGAMEFFSSRRKVTSKWTASYASDSQQAKRMKVASSTEGLADKANFDGKL